MRVTLVAPPMAAPTGGNLYNLGLTRALGSRGVAVRAVERGVVIEDAVVLVDSLYLDALPALARPGRTVGLLAHYLPSLVTGTVPSVIEREAVVAADRVIAPSTFMASTLTALGARGPIDVIEPAIEIGTRRGAPPAGERLRALIVANVIAGKGVLPFLAALDPDAPIDVTVIGDLATEPEYAAACMRVAPLARFAGALPHAAALDALAESELLVSPSRMESYGMALAEARALGIPIVARRGGNVGAHIEERAGGRLLDDDDALAAECLHLAREREELQRRWEAAQASRTSPRSWDDAAREFIAAFER